MTVRAKKHLGQHFLKDEGVAKDIADALIGTNYAKVLEIGPGMGVLTKYLLDKKHYQTSVIEIDRDSVAYLKANFLHLSNRIFEEDFLKSDLQSLFNKEQFAVIGNFPYNISTQIVFRVLENRELVPEFAGMFQKEVAERIAEKEGSKKYGILSVLSQAFYDVEYLFDVAPTVFIPPPKVVSGVIRMTRKENYTLPVDEKMFFRVVKTAFNHRRKMLRKSLQTMGISQELRDNPFMTKRPEQLNVDQFIELTKWVIEDVN